MSEPGGTTPATAPASPDRPVRVVSYNLRGLRDDVGAVVEVVRELDPDVLLLQEIPRRPGSTHRVVELARRCSLSWSGRTRRLAGTGLLTGPRVAATPSRDRPLPVGPRDNPRGYTLGTVRRPGGPVLGVVSIHLPLVRGQRLQHARQVLSELTVDPELQDLPWVIGGDLNEQPDGPAWRALAEHLPVVSPRAPTFATGDPRRRIDAVFATPSLVTTTCVVSAPGRAVLTAASDHLPVLVDVWA